MTIGSEILLKEIIEGDAALTATYNIKVELIRSRIIEYLRARYQPQDGGSLDYYRGANDLLDEIIYFKEIHYKSHQAPVPEARFNSLNTAVQSGEMTQEEADAIRNGKSPDYSKYITRNSIKPE